MSYRNANPDASPYVLVTSEDIPMAMAKGTPPAEVLQAALGHAEIDPGRAIRVYNDGFHVCTITVPA